MSRKRNCWDNAVAESFFGTIKTEFIHSTTFSTCALARTALNGLRSFIIANVYMPVPVFFPLFNLRTIISSLYNHLFQLNYTVHFFEVRSGTSVTALGGNVRPKRYGQKSTTVAAVADELGSLRSIA
ncbi:transposase [Synechocystis salina LEGE 06155]|nr:transposase [Synechocystis salina LEGE 06155]